MHGKQTLTQAGGIPPYIYSDLGGADRWTWFVSRSTLDVCKQTHSLKVLAYLLSLAAVCPFVGSLSDLFGRRYVALIGSGLLIVGNIVCGTVHSMNSFIGMRIQSFAESRC